MPSEVKPDIPLQGLLLSHLVRAFIPHGPQPPCLCEKSSHRGAHLELLSSTLALSFVLSTSESSVVLTNVQMASDTFPSPSHASQPIPCLSASMFCFFFFSNLAHPRQSLRGFCMCLLACFVGRKKEKPEVLIFTPSNITKPVYLQSPFFFFLTLSPFFSLLFSSSPTYGCYTK